MSVKQTIEQLEAIGPRLSGSEGDEQAVELIREQLAVSGREAEVDSIAVRPDHHISGAICALLAVVGSVVSTKSAPAGLIVILIATALFYLDLTARFYSLRYLLPRKKSANVTSPGTNESARARLLITAHHDTGRTGLIEAKFGTRLPGLLGKLAGPIDTIFWLMTIALVLAAVRLLGIDGDIVTALQFVVAVLLLLGTLALIDAAFAKPSPGANDNASGVAAALELARRLDESPPRQLDVWLVFTGGQEGLMLGMRQWLRQRASLLKRKTNFFLNLDSVGGGSVRYVVAEGLTAAYEHNPEMIELCESIAGDFDARPHVWRVAGDGTLPAMQGSPSITVCCLDEADRVPNHHTASDTIDNLDFDSIEKAIDFSEALVREMDSKLLASPKREPAEQEKKPKSERKRKRSKSEQRRAERGF